MDEMTRQNAVLIERASAAAENMRNHALQVSQAMDALNQGDAKKNISLIDGPAPAM
jgi:hypothetical protein